MTKSKVKPKAKSKRALQVKSKPKKKLAKVKRQPVSKKKKPLAKRKLTKKTKPAAKQPTKPILFSSIQKTTLLDTITKIIALHKSDKDGLKSLTQVERILDKYNQNYINADEKFDAIVKYGMEEDPQVIHKHVFVLTNGKDKETKDFYKLLSQVGKGKIKFSDVKEKMNKLLEDAHKSRQHSK
jgi:hypothetical protein